MSDVSTATTGIVIFYDTNYGDKTIKEYGRTKELPFSVALDYYSEIPNPASQLLYWSSEGEKQQVFEQHAKDIIDPKWLQDLFDCI